MKALVLGGAAEVWDSLAETERLFGPGWWELAVACNDIGCLWPHHLDAWCTLHPEKMANWRRRREENGHPRAVEHIGRNGRQPGALDRTIHHPFGNGSSGLLSVAVALHLGATRVVLCGVPMTRTPYFDGSVEHTTGHTFSGANAHWKKWQFHAAELDGRVKSMSGRTQNLLGAPTLEWLNT